MTVKKSEAEGKGETQPDKIDADKKDEAGDTDAPADADEEAEPEADEEKGKAAKKAEAKKPDAKKAADLDSPAVKKALREAEARGRKAAEEKAAADADAAKLTETERLRKEREDAVKERDEAKARAADLEATGAVRDAMDDLEIRPAGARARQQVIADFKSAREKNPDADASDILTEIRKTDGYLFVSTKPGKAAAADDAEDGEEKPTRKPSTDVRGGKTSSAAKPVDKKEDPLSIPVESRDPRAIRRSLQQANLPTQ